MRRGDSVFGARVLVIVLLRKEGWKRQSDGGIHAGFRECKWNYLGCIIRVSSSVKIQG